MADVKRIAISLEIINWNSTHSNQVPDFQTRQKTSLIWSKVFIAEVNGQWTFLELNLLQRLARYFLGWYRETVIAPETRQKVIDCVHTVLSDSYAGVREIQLMKENLPPREAIGYNSMRGLMKAILSTLQESKKPEDLMAALDIEELEKELNQKLVDEFGGIEDKVINSLMELIQNHPLSNAQIVEGFEAWARHEKRDLNKQLLQDLIAVLKPQPVQAFLQKPVEYLPCQGIPVTKGIEDLLSKSINKYQEVVKKSVISCKTLLEHLNRYKILVEASDILIKTKIDVKDLIEKEVDGLRENLNNMLVKGGADPLLVTAYLFDDKKIIERLFYHSVINQDGAVFSKESSLIQREITCAQGLIRCFILETQVRIQNSGKGDCFFISCNQFDSTQDWRLQIANHMRENFELYRTLVQNRTETDDMARGKDFNQYCDWIAQSGSWGGEPELHAFSNLTKRPVIVLQVMGDSPIEWSAHINLHYKGEPYVFLNSNAAHFEAMVKVSE